MSAKQRTLRVTGLDATSDTDALKQHFERYGPVQTCFRMNNVSCLDMLLLGEGLRCFHLPRWKAYADVPYAPYLQAGYDCCSSIHADPRNLLLQSGNQVMVKMSDINNVEPAIQGMDGSTFNGRRLQVR